MYSIQASFSYFCLAPTLEFLINIPVRLLIFDQFSHQYGLIRTSTFVFYEQLIIFYFCPWPIFIRNCIFELIILHPYVYLDQHVYSFRQNFPPVRLFGPVRLLGTLEYTHTHTQSRKLSLSLFEKQGNKPGLLTACQFNVSCGIH